ncbi:MAG TPA: hypothetical protein VN845_08855 [Solirubrobacteraceae bacterium]|nr:hypothetical protein [Solirubrobacteraceae bacterium]
MSERPILAETRTPEGTRVVLFEDTWLRHILLPQHGHPELEHYLTAVLALLPDPDHREMDSRPSRECFFKQGVGPSKWLMVVVDSAQEPSRIVTALGYGHGESPSGWTT